MHSELLSPPDPRPERCLGLGPGGLNSECIIPKNHLGLGFAMVLLLLTNNIAPRSRGHLCMEALRYASAHAACDWVLDHLLHVRYNPCNMLFSDGVDAFCIHYDGHSAQTETLCKGLHLLGDTNINDPEHPRIRRARKAFENLPRQMPDLLDELASLMAEHSTDKDGICLHGTHGGTRSSAIIALEQRTINSGHFYYAEGPPCSTRYVDLSHKLRQTIREQHERTRKISI